MRPFFPFYGSKWRDARRYDPPSKYVIEPFAGSAGYSTWYEPLASIKSLHGRSREVVWYEAGE